MNKHRLADDIAKRLIRPSENDCSINLALPLDDGTFSRIYPLVNDLDTEELAYWTEVFRVGVRRAVLNALEGQRTGGSKSEAEQGA